MTFNRQKTNVQSGRNMSLSDKNTEVSSSQSLKIGPTDKTNSINKNSA